MSGGGEDFHALIVLSEVDAIPGTGDTIMYCQVGIDGHR